MDPDRPDEVNRLADSKKTRISAKRLREQLIFGSLQPAEAVQHAVTPSAPLALCYCHTPPGVAQDVWGMTTTSAQCRSQRPVFMHSTGLPVVSG